MNIGFIGLGSMGRPMVRRLLAAGHSVLVYNRSRDRAQELVAEGARIAETPAAAAAAGIVITMVADDAALEGVVFGENGILSQRATGLLHVSMSTVSVKIAERLTEAHQQAGQSLVSAPVFGRPEAAAAGKLTVIASGPAASIDKARPAFEAFAQKTVVLSEIPRDANLVKLSGNFMIASAIESIGESFALIRKFGIDPKTYFDIMSSTLFALPFYQTYGKIIAEEAYENVGFRLRLGLKDVDLALAAAEEGEVPMPIASILRDRVLSGLARGYADLDWSSIAYVAALDAGLPNFRPKSSSSPG